MVDIRQIKHLDAFKNLLKLNNYFFSRNPPNLVFQKTCYFIYFMCNMFTYFIQVICIIIWQLCCCLFYSLFYLHKCMILWNGLEIIWISLFYSTFPFQKDKTNVCSLWFKKQSLNSGKVKYYSYYWKYPLVRSSYVICIYSNWYFRARQVWWGALNTTSCYKVCQQCIACRLLVEMLKVHFISIMLNVSDYL